MTRLGLGAAAGLLGLAFAADVPLDGRRIYLTDAPDPARRSAHLSLADPDLDLSIVDPTAPGATVEIGRDGGPSVTLELPAAGWTRRPVGSGQIDFRYGSKTGPVQSARLVQGRFVKLSARGPGSYGLDGARICGRPAPDVDVPVHQAGLLRR